MLIPKKTRKEIYESLFTHGVFVAKKDFEAPKHNELENVPNLMAIKALQSLKSRGFVKEQFAWQHYYYTLTDEGIEYLRGFLHLPTEVQPATLKAPAKPEGGDRPARGDRPDRPARPAGSERDSYRRGPAGEKSAGGFKPDFRGTGRGAPVAAQ